MTDGREVSAAEPFDLTAFQNRLDSLILPKESVHAFALRSGVSDSVMRKYLMNDSEPSVRMVARIAKNLQIDMNWLCFGDRLLSPYGQPTSDPGFELSDGPGHYASRIDTDQTSSDVVLIDSSALELLGHRIPDDQRSQPVPFRRDMLQGLNPDNLSVILSVGDSMAPTLSHGDPLLVQLMLTAITPHDGVYVLAVDGALIVKRLQFSPFGDVTIVSDNSAYPSWKCDKEKRTELHIVARAISAIKRF